MPGMNNLTGKSVADIAHLSQSIADILTTPLGTRLERRTYGSLLPELIDHPDNGTTRVRMYAAVGTALMRWEPRVRLSRVAITSGPQPGQATLDLQAEYLPTSQTIGLQLALQLRASV